MDVQHVLSALRDTLLAEKQSDALKTLNEMHKIIGFLPTLLNIVMENSLEIGVRQAASLYFKNNVLDWWKDPDPSSSSGELCFSVHEQDRQAIRSSLVEAIVNLPLPLRAQIKIALSTIIRVDFPSRYTEFPEQLRRFFSSDRNQWYGALSCLHSFVKVYEYKKDYAKDHVSEIMRTFLPVLYAALCNLSADGSDDSLAVQVLILKVFFTYIHFHFPLEVMGKTELEHWIHTICLGLSDFSSAPSDADHGFWKKKKWGTRILYRLFTRYGCPGAVIKRHNAFAEWYIKAFSDPVLSVLLGICEVFRQKSFVSKPVLNNTLEYFTATLSHSFSWKILRPHFSLLARELIFPLLSHTAEDAALWEDDPVEYIRYEAAEFGRAVDPSLAAFTLLSEACLKRRGVLTNIMPFCIHILNSNSPPVEKDAVLHMYGAIAQILLKKETYRNQLEPFLINHVLPTLHAPEGYRRARACWLLGKLAEATFNDQNIFNQVVEEVRKIVFNDQELPVRVFAALCLSELMRTQEQVHTLLIPHLRDLMLQLLKLLRETEFDDLNQVIERLMVTFAKEINPIAVEFTQNLCLTFMQLMGASEQHVTGADNEDSEDLMEYRSMVATSVLNNVESMLQIVEDQEVLMGDLEPIIAQQIRAIFERKMSMFYEEALSLLFSLTTSKISSQMWSIFDCLYGVLQEDASDCFSEMMPCLHNYITVDRAAFISDPKHVEVVAAMCSHIVQSNEHDESVQTQALKLLEVLLLDYRGQINEYIPKFIELSLSRLTQKITSRELRVMCIQLVLAGMLYSPSDMLSVMMEHHWPGTATPVLNEFLSLWIRAADDYLGLHERRLSVLGVCLLISLPTAQRPLVVQSAGEQLILMSLSLFTGLKRAYAIKAQNQADNDDSDEEEDSDDSVDGKALESDEDEVDEEGVSYLEMLEDGDDLSGGSDISDEEADVETALEAFDTELDKPECDMDEYVTFYRVMTELERNDPSWYAQLINNLNEQQQTEMKAVVSTALKCIQQKESKLIEQTGGYVFASTIPKNFDFGAHSGNHPQ